MALIDYLFPRNKRPQYKLPSVSLLNSHNDNETYGFNLIEPRMIIIKVFMEHGIEIDKIDAVVGPIINLYEISFSSSMRVSKIHKLEKDLALNLGVSSLRIISPVPGHRSVGVEVPRANPQVLSVKEIFESKIYLSSNLELPIALGRSITNEIFMLDLSKLPHLLIMGDAEQYNNKSLDTIITSLLFKKRPDELKLVLVDSKEFNLNIYTPIINHYLARFTGIDEAIIADSTKSIYALQSLCVEMSKRFELLKAANVRTIFDYNRLVKDDILNQEEGHHLLPYIVVVIDDYVDLLRSAGSEIESLVTHLTQRSHAVGIHLIINTQYVTAGVISDNIRKNFSSHISFRIKSNKDSSLLSYCPDANKLIGHGDMLYYSGFDSVRIQCAYVDSLEISNVCQHISNQKEFTNAYYLPEYKRE